MQHSTSLSDRAPDVAADGIVAVPTAAELSAAGWDRLVGVEDFFQSPRWLAVQEVNGGTTLDFLIRRRGGVAVAGLVCAWATESVPWLLARPDALLRRGLDDDLDGAAEVAADVAGGDPSSLLPALVCGGRHLGRTRALVAPDGTDDDIADLVAHAEHLAAERGAAAVNLPHVDARDTGLMGVLDRAGYRSHSSEHYAWLPVPDGGFDEFLADMSQHRRRRVRLERRAVADAGVEVTVQPLRPELAPRLGELDANLLRKYGNPASDEHSTGIVARIAEVMGDDALVALARQEGDIIGFGMVLRSRARGDEQWFGHRAGFDYNRQGDLPLYYEVLYYAVLEAAAEAGASVLHAGIGSTPAKTARGCLISEQRSYSLRLPATVAPTRTPGSV